MSTYKNKKVISIGVASELTALSERQIRYYEERKLISPERTKGGTRKYSFSDIEKLVEISNKLDEGMGTFEIRREENRKCHPDDMRKQMLQGQINAQFNRK